MLNRTTGRGKNPRFTDRIHTNPVQQEQGQIDFVRMRQLPTRQQQGDSPLVYPRAENCRNAQNSDCENLTSQKPPINKGGRPRKPKTKEEREAAKAVKREGKVKRNAKANAQHKSENPCQFSLPDMGMKTIYKVFQLRSNQARIVDDFTRWSDRRKLSDEVEFSGNEIVKIAGQYYSISSEFLIDLETGEELQKPLIYSYLGVVYYNMQPDFWVDADGNELDFDALQVYLREEGHECEPVELAGFGDGKNSASDNLKTGSEGLTGKLSKASQRKIMERLDTFVSTLNMINRKIKRKGGKSFRYAAFVTLTLPSEQQHTDKYLKENALKPFLQWLRDQHNVINYLWKAETQRNGRLHFHLIIDRYVHREEVKRHWNKIMKRLGYIEPYAQAQRAKFTNEKGELEFSYTEKELKEQIKRIRERRKKGDETIKLDRTGVKGLALRHLQNRYENAKAANFSQPPSTDVQGLSDMSNAVAYCAKYFSKNNDDAIDGTDKEEIAEYERSQKYRSVEGRLWDCSKDVKALKPFRKIASYSAQTDSGQFLRRTVDVCALDFMKFMDNASKLRGVENGGVRKVVKDYFTNYITKKKIVHYLVGRFVPIAIELENYYIQIYRWMYKDVDGYEEIKESEVPENQQGVKIDPELEAQAIKELEALKTADYQDFATKRTAERVMIGGKITDPELPEIALRREVKQLAYKAKRAAEWEAAAQKIELEEARLKARCTEDEEREEILRLLIPIEERTYFTSCRVKGPEKIGALVNLYNLSPAGGKDSKQKLSIDFRVSRYDLTGFEGLIENAECPF
jgi:hypothetical protein